MEKNQSLNLIQQQLSIYGAQVYNYRGTEFIGVKNPYSDNNMAFTFGEEEFCMEFTFQTARFKYGCEKDCIIHAEKYLTDKLCAVEVFLNDKPIFGGSRETFSGDFTSVEEFATYYAVGNKQIADNLLGFMKNGGVSVKIFSWSGKFDKSFKIVLEDELLKIV